MILYLYQKEIQKGNKVKMTIVANFNYPAFFSLENALYRKYKAYVKQEKISEKEYQLTIECCTFDGKSIINFLLDRANLQKLCIFYQ